MTQPIDPSLLASVYGAAPSPSTVNPPLTPQMIAGSIVWPQPQAPQPQPQLPQPMPVQATIPPTTQPWPSPWGPSTPMAQPPAQARVPSELSPAEQQVFLYYGFMPIAFHRFLTDGSSQPIGIMAWAPVKCPQNAMHGYLGVTQIVDARAQIEQCPNCDYVQTVPRRMPANKRMNDGQR